MNFKYEGVFEVLLVELRFRSQVRECAVLP